MLLTKLSLFVIFILIPFLSCGKTIPINDDPKLDYRSREETLSNKEINEKTDDSTNNPNDESLLGAHEKPLDVTEIPVGFTEKPVDIITQIPVDVTVKPIDATEIPIITTTSELEVEDNLVNIEANKPQKPQTSESSIDVKPIMPSESVTTPSDPITSMCSLDNKVFADKINEMMKKFIPEALKLKPIKRGNTTKIVLDNGRLNINKDFKLVGQPICTKVSETQTKYDFTVSFNDLIGFYEWKIYNLFGYNLSESALITIKQIMTDFVIIENDRQKSKLEDIKVGTIDGLKVKVNIPERLASIAFIKPMLEYVVSRISTMIANGSMDSIVKNIKDIFYQSIQENVRIKP